MNDKQKKTISKFMSLVLRHNPGKIGVTLDIAGWVSVEALLDGCKDARRGITREQLDEVVATNDKKRFEFSPDGLRIRASQGHSVEVNLGYEPGEPPAVLYHGTASRNLPAIRQKGLIKGKRHHVHLSAETATAVSVGTRYGRPVVLEIEARRMAADGFEFFLSTNGVWLVDSVPPKYLTIPECPQE